MNSLYIPVSIIDGFFDNPDEIVEYAESLEYSNEESNYPGVRTECLSKLNRKLYEHVITRFLNVFYDTEYYFVAYLGFQKISGKEGWAHRDEQQITFLIYLNKDSDSEAGTSILTAAPGTTVIHQDKKIEANKEQIDATSFREENNKQFKETIRVSNKYNRLVAFDSPVWHKANDFGKDRLTLICFIDRLDAKNKPIERMRRTK